MADHDSVVSGDKEVYFKKLKRALDRVRELVLLVNSVLLWEQQYYPWGVFLGTSGFFLYMAGTEISVLSSLSLIFMTLNILDVLVPYACSMIWKQEAWSPVKEKHFEDVCKNLASAFVCCKHFWNTVSAMRANNPMQYYLWTILSLLFLAWLGSSVSNLFLTYLLVLAVLMYPGFVHSGLANKCFKFAAASGGQVLHAIGSNKSKPL